MATKTLTITVTGLEQDDLVEQLRDVIDKVRNGSEGGFGHRHTGTYTFTSHIYQPDPLAGITAEEVEEVAWEVYEANKRLVPPLDPNEPRDIHAAVDRWASRNRGRWSLNNDQRAEVRKRLKQMLQAQVA